MVKSKSYLIAFYNKEYASTARNVPQRITGSHFFATYMSVFASEVEVAAGNKSQI